MSRINNIFGQGRNGVVDTTIGIIFIEGQRGLRVIHEHGRIAVE